MGKARFPGKRFCVQVKTASLRVLEYKDPGFEGAEGRQCHNATALVPASSIRRLHRFQYIPLLDALFYKAIQQLENSKHYGTHT